jgi:TatD DNase family protein
MGEVYTSGFDAHTHLDFAVYDDDREAVVARARAAGVATWVIAGSDHEAWDRTMRVAEDTGGIAILGVHPWSAARMDKAEIDPYVDDLGCLAIRGIGEIGLDALHARDAVSRQRQRAAFRDQLDMARERNLPVAIHCVRAYPETIALLEQDGVPAAGGMMHAWSGPADLVDRALALGLYVSFAPLVIRDRARKARESVARVPDGSLLLETDCPNMFPPGAVRGEPAHLVEVAEAVARLRGQDPLHVWAVAAANAHRLWG